MITDNTSSQILTRRSVLVGASLGVAALGIGAAGRSASALDLAPPDKQPENLPRLDPRPKRLGWAIVGLGELSLAQILPAFSATNLCRPVALVSGHPEKAKKVADHYSVDQKNIYSYEDFDKIKENPEIDIVYIVLPNSMHAEFTVRAFQAGKHVLCEKPLAPTVEECNGMISASKRAGRKLMTAYRLRYEPFNQHMIKLAREKMFGDIRLISAENVQDVKAPNIRLSKKLAGGPLGDVGVYCLNAARYVTGEEPSEVNAMEFYPTDDLRFQEVPDRVVFQLRFPSGILANCSAGFSAQETRRYSVQCENGTFGLDPAFSYSGLAATIQTKTGKEFPRIEQANHFASEMDHFASCVASDLAVTTPGEDGLRDVEIMTKIHEAIRERKTIAI